MDNLLEFHSRRWEREEGEMGTGKTSLRWFKLHSCVDTMIARRKNKELGLF